MGLCGVELFHDDVAIDVQDGYLLLIRQGVPAPEATRLFLEEFTEALERVQKMYNSKH